jgi:hypothetical protein
MIERFSREQLPIRFSCWAICGSERAFHVWRSKRAQRVSAQEILAWFHSTEIVSSLIVCPFAVSAIPACVSGLANGNEIYFDMADRLAALIHDSSMDATKTVKTVYGTFVIVRRWIERFIPTMYHKYLERNDHHANHKQPIFLAILYRLRNSVLKESHRRNQTSTSEDQTPQNLAYSSERVGTRNGEELRPYSIHQ